jgi:hypothetical protein
MWSLLRPVFPDSPGLGRERGLPPEGWSYGRAGVPSRGCGTAFDQPGAGLGGGAA